MTTAERVVYFNGEYVAESEARISIYDSSLMFGDMVFEMTRSFNQKQFKLREHIERLYASIRAVAIPIEMSASQLEQAVYDTIDANRAAFEAGDEHRVMINVSRGLLSIYRGRVRAPAGPNVIAAVFPLRWTVRGMAVLFTQGINAVIPAQRAIPADLLDAKVKSRSRLHYMMANIQVAQVGGDRNWALLLDPDGFVAEGTGDNFFIVKDGEVVTPEGRNILRGISRQYVMETLAADLGVRAVERNIDRYDVSNADEAFMTGTPFCLLPVTALDGVAIGSGAPGPITRSLLDRWSANVGVDIAGQIAHWDACANESAGDGPSPYAFRRAR